MAHPLIQKAKEKMEKSLQAAASEFSKIRTGRASTSLLEEISVEYYGARTPINQVGTLGVPEPRLITIAPWEASLIPAIEKAIQNAGIGLTPSNDGKVIRIPVPALTEERRKEMVKLIKKYAEEGKVAVRHVRREILDELQGLEKKKELSEDDNKKNGTEIQKLTDLYIQKIDDAVAHKEREVMEV